MRRKIIGALIFLCVMHISSAQNILPLIPQPASVKINEGDFLLSEHTIIVTDNSSIPDAEIFNLQLEKIYGFKLSIFPRGRYANASGIISLAKNKNGKNDGYDLRVSKDEILIKGNGAGVFYGLQSLIQLIRVNEKIISITCCDIKDSPRFQWRGMHLDVSRHFFSKNFIKKYIDLIALYKMNTFHWHLTDDQGWRIEIKKYPKLTEVGSHRSGTMVGHYRDHKFDSIPYGGYYTQEDVKEIVEYAKQRHVTIVPEIEMPGHALAAVASYPQYSCTGGPFEVGKGWGGYDDVFCPGNDSTFIFLKNILGEVCKLFPGKYIHIGGDECSKTRWKSCPKCQARIRKNHLKNEQQLQSYFTKRIVKILRSNGKQVIGWDEILEGGLAPNAAVMSWRGTEGGITAAGKRYKVVMSPGAYCYFDHYQGLPLNEPLAIGGYTTVEKVYSYEPIPEKLNPRRQKYILGAQGNLWTEYIRTPQQVEYMVLPRMCALAEVLWSSKEKRNYPEFQKRLIENFSLLDRLDVNYAKSIYEIKLDVKSSTDENGIDVMLTAPSDKGQIFYSLDGSVPALLFDSIINIRKSCKLKAFYAETGKGRGNLLSQDFFVSLSTGKKITAVNPPHENHYCNGIQSLVDGMKGDLHKYSQNWPGWWGTDLNAVIDLGEKKKFSKISMDVYDDEGSWIYLPKSIEVFISDDGINFTTLKKISAEEVKKYNEAVVINTGEQSARYVKVVAENFGKIPDGKQGSGNNSWLFVDEISVE